MIENFWKTNNLGTIKNKNLIIITYEKYYKLFYVNKKTINPPHTHSIYREHYNTFNKKIRKIFLFNI